MFLARTSRPRRLHARRLHARRLHTPLLHDYLAYARTNQVNTTSTVFTGTVYEHSVLHLLQTTLAIDRLQVVGGANDQGVDIVGQWTLPPTQIDVYVQCKAVGKPVGARTVREMIGACQLVTRQTTNSLLVFVLSPQRMTLHGARAVDNTPLPLVYVQITQPHLLRGNMDGVFEYTPANYTPPRLVGAYCNPHARTLLNDSGMLDAFQEAVHAATQ